MGGELVNRWEKVLRLAAVATGDRGAATSRVRDAFDAAGAFITDVHFFSGVQTTFAFEVAAERLSALRTALLGAGLSLDDASRVALDDAVANACGEATGTLAVMFVEGDPDLKREIPAVPG